MAYIPDPTDASQPVESVLAETAAAEFRALKAYVQSIVAGGGPGGSLTPGMIAMFPTNIGPPPGWLECDGSLKSRTTFATLWAACGVYLNTVSEATWAGGYFGLFSTGDLSTNFRVPDLRGVFPRGYNHGKAGSSFDPGRDIGNLQAASSVWNNGGNGSAIIQPGTGDSVKNGDEATAFSVGYNLVTPGTSATTSAGYSSVRPINISLMFCVKT